MPESQHSHIRTLFRSKLIHILDYRCTGHDNFAEEYPQDFEIILPRAGAYQRRDTYGTFLADPNQIIFSNAGESYEISHPVKGGDTSTVFLFAPALLIEMLRVINPDIENTPYRLFQHNHITFNSRLQILQYQLLRADRHALDTLAIEEKVTTLVAEILYESYQGETVKQKPSRNTIHTHVEQIRHVKNFLNANIRTPLQLEHISSAVHLSPYHLCRIFKKNTGMTLHQYVKRLRLFNAVERMLDHPTTRLDMLALEYSFSNHGHFSTVFRQVFGISPSELRSTHFRQLSKNLKA